MPDKLQSWLGSGQAGVAHRAFNISGAGAALEFDAPVRG